MPNYRRNFVAGGTFFFTVVVDQRRTILQSAQAVDWLRESIRETKSRYEFVIFASVILPDHLHMIWTLPAEDARFDRRWSSIKRNFTERWLEANGLENNQSSGRQNERRRGIWQPRFIEHTIRDETDLERHVDYIHFNPVKHGYVQRPVDWPYSSFHRFVQRGWLTRDWGCGPNDTDCFERDIDTGLLDV